MLHQLLLQLAVTAASASDLQAELLRLEGLQRAKTIGGGDQLRLAELYFLTSRCEDVRKILKPLSKGPKGEATGAAGDL
ncbi:MAG: hypothetical protein HY075_16350, partial [Deltaproteobacteria bacterium]|nr:hypothetical protein [Deltaproteobacteria bacterium]